MDDLTDNYASALKAYLSDSGELALLHAYELGRQALARVLDELHQACGKPIIITECGADTLPGGHNTPGEMWTEE